MTVATSGDYRNFTLARIGCNRRSNLCVPRTSSALISWRNTPALVAGLLTTSTPDIHSPINRAGSENAYAIVSIPLVQNIHQVSWKTGRGPRGNPPDDLGVGFG